MPGPQLEYQVIDKQWYPTGLMALPARGSQQWDLFCGRNTEGCFEQARHRSAEIPVQLASELGDTAQVSELVCPVHEANQFYRKAPVFQHTRRAQEQEQRLSFSNQPYCRWVSCIMSASQLSISILDQYTWFVILNDFKKAWRAWGWCLVMKTLIYESTYRACLIFYDRTLWKKS